ncbi:MAG TPA: hypothetical protein DCZ10_20045 [Pelotomaculum sp.]|nr:hypothetical protein [Pelotomaculum sp.]
MDRTLFRGDIDVDTAIGVILYTFEGYAQGEANPVNSAADHYSEYGRYLSDLDRYIKIFRTSFYQ